MTSPAEISISRPSWTLGRETPNDSASLRSAGSFSPGDNSPFKIDDLICSATCSEIFSCFTGLKFIFDPFVLFLFADFLGNNLWLPCCQTVKHYHMIVTEVL